MTANTNLYSKYLIASNKDLLWGLKINSVGFQKIKSGENYPPNNHPRMYLFSNRKGRILKEYQLLYISEGTGFFESSNQKKTEINAGHMFLLFPYEWHNYAPMNSTGWSEYWIGFEGTNMDNKVDNGFFSVENPIFNIGVRTDLIQLYSNAIDIALQQHTGFQQLLSGITEHLLGIAYAQHKTTSFKNLHTAEQMRKAKIIIYEQFAENISPEEIASQVNMSYSWFRRIFKKYTGLSPNQYIQEVRIQKSKELLIHTQLSSQEIADKVGFDNSDYFCAAFRRKTKLTPTKYRNLSRSVGNNEL